MHLCRYTAMILAACIFTALLSQSGANQQLKSFKTFNFNWPPNVVHLQGTKTLKMHQLDITLDAIFPRQLSI